MLSEISGSYTRVVDFSLMQLVEIAKGCEFPNNLIEYMNKNIA